MVPGDNAASLRLAGIQYETIVDGPGIRLALYLQGCFHNCPGCHNPETHDFAGGYEASLEELAALIRYHKALIDGVTFSGGEPFAQAFSLANLAAEVIREGLNLVLYSGYLFEELLIKSRTEKHTRYLLEAGWLLVDGPYRFQEQDLNLAFRGSKNQRLIDLKPSLEQGKPVLWSDPAWKDCSLV